MSKQLRVEKYMTKNDGLLPISIGVTGHRDINVDEFESCKISLSKLFTALAKKFPNTPLNLISSLAEGADRIAAATFIETQERLVSKGNQIAKQWKLIACLPMQPDVYETDFPNSKEEFYTFLEKSNRVFRMPIRNSSSFNSVLDNGEDRNFQYQDASRFVASHSDILVALWDGIDPGLVGGTADTVKLRASGHKFDRLQKLSALAAQSRHVIYQIKVSRVSTSSGLPAPFLDKIFTDQTKLLHSCNFLNDLEMFNIAVSERLTDEKVEKSKEHLASHLSNGSNSFEHNPLLADLINYFSTSNMLAIHFQRQWLWWVQILYGVGFLTALLLPMAVENMFFPYSMIIYIFLMALGAAVFIWLKQTAFEDRHLNCRALAELLRIQFFLSLSEFWTETQSSNEWSEHRKVINSATVAERLIGQHHFDLDWISERIRNLITMSEVNQHLNNEMAETLIFDWVSGQSAYYKKAHERLERQSQLLRILSSFMLVGGLLAAVVAILGSYIHFIEEGLHHLAVMLSAALPIMAVIVESYGDKLAIEPSIKVQSKMRQIYAEAHRLLKIESLSIADKKDIVRQLADNAIYECISWLMLKKIKPIKLPT